MPSVLLSLLAAAAFLACSATRLDRCTEQFYEQELDHFRQSSQRATWRQRYFVCDEYWRHSVSAARPIFFYTGTLRGGRHLQQDLQLLALLYDCACILAKFFTAALCLVESRDRACIANAWASMNLSSLTSSNLCLQGTKETLRCM